MKPGTPGSNPWQLFWRSLAHAWLSSVCFGSHKTTSRAPDDVFRRRQASDRGTLSGASCLAPQTTRPE